MREKISVIIPVLNEAHQVQRVLAPLKVVSDLEVIVVDGGSHDQTVERAKAMGVTVTSSRPGRARQMNQGAKLATGDILLFLHADTRLPEGFTASVRQALSQPNAIAGAFELKIDSPHPGLRLVEWGVKWRSRLFQLPYGDQVIFLKAATFHQLEGFPDLPIMEDFELVRRLKLLGQIVIVSQSVLTSNRRWSKLGILQTTLLNQLIIIGYFLGVDPGQLARWYRGRSPFNSRFPTKKRD